MSCDNFAPLPAIMYKMIFDNAPATPNTADSCGKIAFAEFMNSSDTDNAICFVVVFMEEVVWQDDVGFKLFFENVANGCLTMDDIKLIQSHYLHNLSEE